MFRSLRNIALPLCFASATFAQTLVTNTYRVKTSFMLPVPGPLDGSAYGFTKEDLLDDDDVTEYLSSMAVSFPPGAYVSYDKIGKQLCAENTEENLGLIEWIVNRLNATRWQPYFDRLMVHFATRQQSILRECERGQTPTEMARSAYILRALWGENLLTKETKDALVDRYYKLVLSQPPAAYPAFEVKPRLSFPFPDTFTDFSCTLYVNNEVVGPSDLRTSHAMSVQGDDQDLTSSSGGTMRNGDIVYYVIKLEQRIENPETRQWDRVVWAKTLRTNEIVVQGLKARN